MFSNIEVEVNGQETFSISLKLIAFFSGKLRRLFGHSTAAKKTGFKLLLHGFPGGPEGFELIVRFCYNGGRIVILPSNVILLHAAARFLEINENQTEKYLQTIHSWTWFELLDCLKQFQELIQFTNSSTVAQEILDALVEKISMPNVSSPFSNFFGSENSSVQCSSGDVSSANCSSRSSNIRRFNWLRDLEFLNVGLFEKVTSAMISRKLESRLVCSFLAHYQKVKLGFLLETDEKCKLIEILVTCLCSLDWEGSSFPFRGLCDMLRVCFALKMESFWVKKVERMIGSRLDEATLDDLLVRARPGKQVACAFDVSLVLRFSRIFAGQNGKKLFSKPPLKKVGSLVDSYLSEVVPDRELKPCTFLALALCLPDAARETHDRVFEAIDMYFRVHDFISEEEKMKMCSVLNYEKLSSESLMQMSQNGVFPASAIAAAVFHLKSKLKYQSNDWKNVELRSNSCSSSLKIDVEQMAPRKTKRCKKSQEKCSGCCYK